MMTVLTDSHRQSVRSFLAVGDERGLSSVEYVVLLVLVVAASVGLWKTFEQEFHDKITITNTSFALVKASADPSQTPSTNGNATPASTPVAAAPIVAATSQPAPAPAPAPATEGAPGKTKEDR